MKENFEYETGKEYLTMYVSKEFKQIWEESQDKNKLFEKYIIKHIEDVKKDIKSSINALDEETLVFRASAIKYKQEFEEIVYGIRDESYKLWEKASEKRSEVTKNFNNVKDEVGKVIIEIDKVEKRLNELDKKLECISPYRLEKLLEVLDKIENMSETKQKIFTFLLSNKEEWL